MLIFNQTCQLRGGVGVGVVVLADGRDLEGLEFKTGFGGISFIVTSLFLDPVSTMLY